MPLLPLAPPPAIIVTAGREAVPAPLAGVSASVIDAAQIETLALPQATDFLRLTPSAAVAVSGGPGQQTQVRLRGAEANHTLVFIDGIEANDPASSSEFLFQTLPAAGIERIEVLRGPQSALWGSAAIGGVVSVTTLVPTLGYDFGGNAEGGSFGTFRLGGAGSFGTPTVGASLIAAYQSTNGIDVSGTDGGDKDGFRNLVLSGKVISQPAPWLDIGGVVRWSDSSTRYDGYDFVTSRPADEPLSTDNTALALRGYAEARLLDDSLSTRVEVTWFDSANINRNAGAYVNRTDGDRLRIAGQASYRFETGALAHRLTGAIEWSDEQFESRAADPADLASQSAARDQLSGIGEYRLELAERAALSVSVRHDDNSGFADATTVRAAAAAALGQGFTLHASYGEGVTNPTFTEQFGFFPDFFVGNPDLKPERARGFDVGLGWAKGKTALDVTWHQTRLEDEIVSTFDFDTFLSGVANASAPSRRKGLEVSGEVKPLPWLTLAASYAYLDATAPELPDGLSPREVRRPRHSGSISATADNGPFGFGFSLALVGDRDDLDFATFPATTATLGSYGLASISGRYEILPGVDLTARLENAFNADYEDVLGYRTPGIGGYVGVRLRRD